MNDSPAKPLLSHRDVIDRWATLSDFAQDIGVSYDAAKQMRRRNSIGDDYRPAVVSHAARRGFAGITFELLTLTAPRRGGSADAASAVAGSAS
jgi:hypothetical protein